jgi:hypothetical protein
MKKIGDRIAEPHFHEMVNGRKVVFLYSSSVPCSLRWILDGKFSAHFLGQKTAGNATKTEDEREEAQHETNNSQMGWAPFISISPTKWAHFFFCCSNNFSHGIYTLNHTSKQLANFVEILGLFISVHNRFQKFLEISKPMCVSPCDMQPKLLAAQRQGVGAKFSPT